jgi:hypothetical protein
LHRPGLQWSPGRRQGGRVDSIHRPSVPTVPPHAKLCARIRRCASISRHPAGRVRPSDPSMARFAGPHKESRFNRLRRLPQADRKMLALPGING